MFKKAVLLTWSLAFIMAEILGLSVSYLAYTFYNIKGILCGAIADIVIVTIRFFILIYIARMCGVSLADAMWRPLPRLRKWVVVLVAITAVILFDYFITLGVYSVYEPQLLGIENFIRNNALLLFPFKIAYYFSEIVVMNYMYILAKKAWVFLKPPITSGTLFLIFGWALLHLLTKNIIVALYAICLVVIFYVSYEYSKSPITPIILWFVVLIV